MEDSRRAGLKEEPEQKRRNEPVVGKGKKASNPERGEKTPMAEESTVRARVL